MVAADTAYTDFKLFSAAFSGARRHVSGRQGEKGRSLNVKVEARVRKYQKVSRAEMTT